MARILAIGTATLDLIFTITRYPGEDAELRARGLRISPGGNAANTLVVLSQLGHAHSRPSPPPVPSPPRGGEGDEQGIALDLTDGGGVQAGYGAVSVSVQTI